MYIYQSLCIISYHMKTTMKPTHWYQISQIMDGSNTVLVVCSVIVSIFLTKQKRRGIWAGFDPRLFTYFSNVIITMKVVVP